MDTQVVLPVRTRRKLKWYVLLKRLGNVLGVFFWMCFHTSLWSPLWSTFAPLLAPKGTILSPFASLFGHFFVIFGTPNRAKKTQRLDVCLILAILDTSLSSQGQNHTKTILLHCLPQSAQIKKQWGGGVAERYSIYVLYK